MSIKQTKQSLPIKQQIYTEFKSQTLNPESTQQLTQYDDKFLTSIASRAKRKLQDTAITKYRFSLSSSTKSYQKQQKQSKLGNKFKPNISISTIIRKRHDIQNHSQRMNNFYIFLQQRFQQQYKKKKALQQRQIRIKDTIKCNKSQKQMNNSTINKHKQRIYVKNLHSHSQIFAHRQNLSTTLQKSRKQKKQAGQFSRKQTQINHHTISTMKLDIQNNNKLAYQRTKKQQQIHRINRIQRRSRNKRIAQQNYKQRWFNQFMNKEKVEKEDTIRTRKISKKIEYLLSSIQHII